MKVEHEIKNGLYTIIVTAENRAEEEFLSNFYGTPGTVTTQLHGYPEKKELHLTLSKRM